MNKKSGTKRAMIFSFLAMTLIFVGSNSVFSAELKEVSHECVFSSNMGSTSFNISVFPSRASYSGLGANGYVSEDFGSGTVLDYSFFNGSSGTVESYADGPANIIGPVTAPTPDTTTRDEAQIWTASDPGEDWLASVADFTMNTSARSDNVNGTIDISGMSDGRLYFIYGGYRSNVQINLTMTGPGQPDVQLLQAGKDYANNTEYYVAGVKFSFAQDYDTITYEYNSTSDKNITARSIFTGVVVTGPLDPAIPKARLLTSFEALKGHVDGTAPMSFIDIATHKNAIDLYQEFFGYDNEIIAASLDLVETYDSVIGPLLVTTGKLVRDQMVSSDIEWVIYHVMQYIMDWTYTDMNMSRYESLLGSFKFGSSNFFPGRADPPADPDLIYTTSINASFPKTFGHDTLHWTDRDARKPTGAYLAPGTVATVTVPASMVGNGYQIRVGAHSWDFSKKKDILRLDRCSLVYNIYSTQVKIASPLGGGIYIEVPYLADAGVVDIQIQNAIRAPYFSAKSFHQTTLEQWQNTERHNPAPWADFQSEKYMMQVPTGWIYNLDDPAALMADWDKAMDAVNDLMGFDHVRGKESHYNQVDVLLRASVYSPGYPSVNNTYNPLKNDPTSGLYYNGNYNQYLLRGPQHAPYQEFHELGHGYKFDGGESESTVNLLHVAAWNRKFGYNLDYSFAASIGGQASNPIKTLDNTSVSLMICQNFIENQSMSGAEKKYQLKGHAKFVEIARLFGWDVLGDFWRSFNDDYENSVNYATDTDSRMLRLSKAVGYDVRPLFHFWGMHPNDPQSLQSAIEAEDIPASYKIYFTLYKYKSLVPADNAAYRDYVFSWWREQPNPGSTDSAEQYRALLWDTYDESYADQTRSNVQSYIDLYFPDGHLGPDMITWSGKSVQMGPNFYDVYVPTSFSWTADPAEGVVFSDPASQNPTVRVNGATSNQSLVTIKLTTDGSGGIVSDDIILEVYDDSCKAAIASGASIHPCDLDGNCIVNLSDFVIFAGKWLDVVSVDPILKQ